MASLTDYVLDSSALLGFLQGAPSAERVAEVFKQAHAGKASVRLSVVNWGEVFYTLYRQRSPEQASSMRQVVERLAITLTGVGAAEAEAAAVLKVRYKLPYADCFAASLALDRKATLITADRDFKRLGRTIKILWLGTKER